MDVIGPIIDLALKGIELVISLKKWRDSAPQDLRDIADMFIDINELLWFVRLLRLQARSVHDFDQDLLAKAIKAERRGCAALTEADGTIIKRLKAARKGQTLGCVLSLKSGVKWVGWRGEQAEKLREAVVVNIRELEEVRRELDKALPSARPTQNPAARRSAPRKVKEIVDEILKKKRDF